MAGAEMRLATGVAQVEAFELELTYNYGKSDYELGNQFGHLAFHTENLDPIIEKVESNGWPYRKSRPELSSKYIFIQDPNGYDIEILEKLG